MIDSIGTFLKGISTWKHLHIRDHSASKKLLNLLKTFQPSKYVWLFILYLEDWVSMYLKVNLSLKRNGELQFGGIPQNMVWVWSIVRPAILKDFQLINQIQNMANLFLEKCKSLDWIKRLKLYFPISELQ